jgi:hypothetical protein
MKGLVPKCYKNPFLSCVFEKNAVKVWNLLGNALEKF